MKASLIQSKCDTKGKPDEVRHESDKTLLEFLRSCTLLSRESIEFNRYPITLVEAFDGPTIHVNNAN